MFLGTAGRNPIHSPGLTQPDVLGLALAGLCILLEYQCVTLERPFVTQQFGSIPHLNAR